MLRKPVYIVFFILCFLQISTEAAEKEFAILRSRENAGMFSEFNDVLMLLDHYEQGLYAGIEVDFGTSGLYYDPNYGPNWWQYYCEPIKIGKKAKSRIRDVAFQGVVYTPHDRANYLIQKYIHIKPHVQDKIDDFVEKYFSSPFIVGIHYRGTDKVTESPRIPYENAVAKLNEYINYYKISNYKIFVATDEIEFLNYIQSLFHDKVIYNVDAIRSNDGKPVHINVDDDHYKLGEDALIDSVLLSKTNLLIRTHSHLSFWSTLLNPSIHCIVLYP